MSKQKITSPFYGLFRGCLRFKIRDLKYIPSRLYYFFKHGFSISGGKRIIIYLFVGIIIYIPEYGTMDMLHICEVK